MRTVDRTNVVANCLCLDTHFDSTKKHRMEYFSISLFNSFRPHFSIDDDDNDNDNNKTRSSLMFLILNDTYDTRGCTHARSPFCVFSISTNDLWRIWAFIIALSHAIDRSFTIDMRKPRETDHRKIAFLYRYRPRSSTFNRGYTLPCQICRFMSTLDAIEASTCFVSSDEKSRAFLSEIWSRDIKDKMLYVLHTVWSRPSTMEPFHSVPISWFFGTLGQY